MHNCDDQSRLQNIGFGDAYDTQLKTTLKANHNDTDNEPIETPYKYT